MDIKILFSVEGEAAFVICYKSVLISLTSHVVTGFPLASLHLLLSKLPTVVKSSTNKSEKSKKEFNI